MCKFSHTIVRKPCKEIVEGLTTANLGKPVYPNALIEHKEYITALKKAGVIVYELDEAAGYADSCFVEDPAVVTDKVAVITNPGAQSRNGEKELILPSIKKFFENIEYITTGTLEGGDVMQIKNHFYIGLSSRTDEDGANNLGKILEKYAYTYEIVKLKEMFHLKTGVNYIGDNTVLVSGEFIEDKRFASFDKIVIDDDEAYSANCIRVNDKIIMPKGYAGTKKKLEDKGFALIEVNMHEYVKIDGGLSCLSLRW